MPRDGSGNYSLPSGNPVAAGAPTSATWANQTMEDLANEVEDSLSRSGKGGMLAPFLLPQGTVGAPALSFEVDDATGFYLAAAGDLRFSALGNYIGGFNATDGLVADRAKFGKSLASALEYQKIVFTNGWDTPDGGTLGVQQVRCRLPAEFTKSVGFTEVPTISGSSVLRRTQALARNETLNRNSLGANADSAVDSATPYDLFSFVASGFTYFEGWILHQTSGTGVGLQLYLPATAGPGTVSSAYLEYHQWTSASVVTIATSTSWSAATVGNSAQGPGTSTRLAMVRGYVYTTGTPATAAMKIQALDGSGAGAGTVTCYSPSVILSTENG